MKVGDTRRFRYQGKTLTGIVSKIEDGSVRMLVNWKFAHGRIRSVVLWVPRTAVGARLVVEPYVAVERERGAEE